MQLEILKKAKNSTNYAVRGKVTTIIHSVEDPEMRNT